MPVGRPNRRAFIAGLGGAAVWPAVGGAQQPAMPVIGYIWTGSRDSDAFRLRGAFDYSAPLSNPRIHPTTTKR